MLWFRTGLHDPHHRPGSFPYSTGYLVAALLFVVSVAFDGPLPDAVRWLLVGSLAGAVLSIALIAWALELRRTQPELYRTAEIALPLSALLCLGVGLTDWGAKASLTAMVVLLLAPVAAGTLVWLKHPEPNTVDLD
mgnify:CR=1 FL=1